MELVNWLKGLKGITAVKPCLVTIKGVTYKAAWYSRWNEPLQGARSQAPYETFCIYCLGSLPKGHKHSNIDRLRKGTQYNVDGAPLFIGGYMQNELTLKDPMYKQYWPLGKSFQLMLDMFYEADKSIFTVPEIVPTEIEWL